MNDHPHINPKNPSTNRTIKPTTMYTTYQTIKRVGGSQRLREKQPTTTEGVVGVDVNLDLS